MTNKNQANVKGGEIIKGNDFKTRAERFMKRFKDLCQEEQCQIVTTPVFKLRDDGTYSLVIQTQVGEMKKN